MRTWTSGPDGAGEHISFRTTCGREVRVGYLALGGSCHPAKRVSLDIGASPQAGYGTWAGLTVGEARRLAEALLAQAAAAERDPSSTEHRGVPLAKVVCDQVGHHRGHR